MRVAIVGAGISGLAAAALLARDGDAVTVFERAPTLASLGAGLLISPCGMEVLDHLGVLREVAEKSTVIRSLLGTTPTGRRVLDLRYETHAAREKGRQGSGLLGLGVHGLGVHRGVLFEALRGAAMAAKVSILTGHEIVAAHRDAEGSAWSLELGDASRSGPFDLLIAADGARSRLRSTLAHVSYSRAYPWGALWFVARDRGGAFKDQLRQVYGDTRRMIGFLPSGMVDGSRVVSVFWSLRTETLDRVRGDGLEAFKAAARTLAGPELGPALDDVLEQITSMDQLIFAPYFDVLARRRRSVRGVLLGDAAHAMSPQLGQGANLGLCDAMELAAQLRADRGDLEASLVAYELARLGPSRYYARVSRLLTPWFQSDHAWLAPIRDIGMPLACMFPPTRREMRDALMGVKTGWVSSRALPVPLDTARTAIATRR